MKIIFEDLSFGFGKSLIFKDFSLSLENHNSLPLVILGPSGCGKTSLLKLMAGLLYPAQGRIVREGEEKYSSGTKDSPGSAPLVSMIFQEPRLLPWFTVLENIALPLEKILGKEKSRDRAMDFLGMVSLQDKALFLPGKLSGGQQQRAAIARSFAYPSDLLLMDEPFQSLDIPLRIELMDLCLSLLEKDKRLAVLVTHDPREAVYVGSRIMILGEAPRGMVYDEEIKLSREDRSYGSAAAGELEKRLIDHLK